MRIISTFYTISLFMTTSCAYAAGVKTVADYNRKLSNSPYEACKNIHMLHQDDYEKDKIYWDSRCKGNEKIQIIPKSGAFITEIQNVTSSLALLQRVGEKAQETVNKKISEKEKVLKCFQDSNLKNQFKETQKDCEKIRQEEITNAYTHFSMLRQELALSEGDDPSWEGVRTMKLVFPPVSKMVNHTLEKKHFGFAGVYRADDIQPLTAEEKLAVEKNMQEDIEMIKTNPELKTEKQKLSTFNQIRATHKAQYLQLLQTSPILTVLGKLPDITDPKAVNEAFIRGYSELLKLAKKERTKMNLAWMHASITPPGKVNRLSKAKNSEDSARELLSFMSYTPLVNETIKEQMESNPQICTLATGLFQSMENSDFRSNLATTGAMTAGAVVVTVVTAGAGALVIPEMIPVIGGMALSAQTAAALALGPSIGQMARNEASEKLELAKGALVAEVKDANALEQASEERILGKVLIPLDLVGSGAFKLVSNATYKTMAKSALQLEGLGQKEAEKVIALAQNGESMQAKEARAHINSSINKKVATYFPSRKPASEELEAAAELEEIIPANKVEGIRDFFTRIQKEERAQHKELLANSLKLIKSLNPKQLESASPKELQDLNRQVIAIARYGEVSNPEKVAAIFYKWSNDAKNGLAATYEDAKKLLDINDFMKGKPLKERRELAFKKALENKKVAPAEINTLCICANVCSGGARVSTSLMNIKKLENAHVCAFNEKTIWYYAPTYLN